MFDSKMEIEIKARTATGIATLSVRWPTDEEWAVWKRARKTVIRQQGRGVTETLPPMPGEADVALYQKIAINGAPQMTPAEAAHVLDLIAVCDVVDVRIDGDEAEVEMKILTGLVKHRMKLPTMDQVATFQRSGYRLLQLPYGQQEVRTNPDAGARLYDQCDGKSSDYDGGIPSLHKEQAARSVIDCVDRMLGPRQDESSF